MLMRNPAKDVEPSVSFTSEVQSKKVSRATFGTEEEEEKLADIEDADPRFLHIIQTSDGADIKRKFFKNTSGEYLM